jgi:hypothetical protein
VKSCPSIELVLPNLELVAGLFGLMYVARQSVESSACCYEKLIGVTNRFSAATRLCISLQLNSGKCLLLLRATIWLSICN